MKHAQISRKRSDLRKRSQLDNDVWLKPPIDMQVRTMYRRHDLCRYAAIDDIIHINTPILRLLSEWNHVFDDMRF